MIDFESKFRRGGPDCMPVPVRREPEAVTRLTDSEHLEGIRQEVFDYLSRLGVPITTRNVIHAMFNIHYADWLGGEGIIPDCPLQDSYCDGL